MNKLPDQNNPGRESYNLQMSYEHHPKKQILYFRRSLQVFFKYKKIILSLFVGIFSLVSIGTFLIPKVYRANATIVIERHIDTEKSVLLGIDSDNLRDLKDWLIAEIEILKSTPVINRVVQSLNLTEGQKTGEESSEEFRLKAIEQLLTQLKNSGRLSYLRQQWLR